MGELHLTRRAILAALASTSATAALAAAPALDGARFRDVRVDVSALRDKYEDESAARLAVVLPGYLRQTFAKYLAPGDRNADVLVARIDNVTLGSSHSSAGYGVMATDTTDSIEGAGLALDARGRLVGSYPLLSAFGADTQEGTPFEQDVRIRRIDTLGLSFAQWLPGQMGL